MGATLIAALYTFGFGQVLDGGGWLAIQAVVAAALSTALGLSWGLRACATLFIPALATAVHLQWNPAWAAVCLALLLAVYGGTQSTRVPLYLSSRTAIARLDWLIDRHDRKRVLDLGCGTGGVLEALGHRHAGVRFAGVERAPLPCLIAWLRGRWSNRRFAIEWRDLRSCDLSRHDLVYAYLSPAPMPELWRKAKREMASGALLVSFCFDIPGVMADEILDAGGKPLFVWRMP